MSEVNKRYALVIDMDRCTGCQTCVMACKVEHNILKGSGIRMDSNGTNPHNTGTNTAPGKPTGLAMHYRPIACMHCESPPCADACPEDAIYKDIGGIVVLDQSKCNSCQACIPACPYQAVFYEPGRDSVFKCDLCSERVKDDFEPFCVVCCNQDAMYFGDILDPASRVSQIIAGKSAEPFRAQLKTGPGTHYCPPRPRRDRG